MSRVFITAIQRSAVGKFLGTLATESPVDLGTQLLKKMIEKDNFPTDEVDEIMIGNVLSAGHGQNMARQISLKAGISETIPSYTINMLCGSGLKTVGEAYQKIKAGLSQAMIVGGVESMSGAGFVASSSLRQGQKMGTIKNEDVILIDGLTDALGHYHMGITAENLAEKYHLTREMQDEFAIYSQEKARAAQEAGRFSSEILPIEIKNRKQTIVFDEDEYINYTTTLEKLSQLRPAFKADGTVTAGNSSGINDGAAFAFVVSEEFMKEHQLTPLVEIVGFGQGGVDPSIMGIGPVPAIHDVLKKTELSLDQIDTIELNEAFAAQSLAVVKQLSEDFGVKEQDIMDKTNPNGGAIAIGHPLGASGARILTTLVHEMKRQNHQYGLASLCIGGGMGVSMIIKNVEEGKI